MKTLHSYFYPVAVCMVIAGLILPVTKAAAQTSNVVGEDTCQDDTNIALTIRFVTLPDAPAFAAKGKGRLCYTIKGSSAAIKGESIPDMIFESEGPIGGFSKLTVVAKGIPGTTPTIDWSGFPKVTIKHLDIRLKAYNADENSITDSTTPLIDVIISDIALSTDKVTVEGMESQGYIDAEKFEAQVVGQVTLPGDDMSKYKEWLANKPAIFELIVKLPNPYEKRR